MDFNDFTLIFQIRNISYLSQIHKPIQYISASVTPWHKINRGKGKAITNFTSVITIELSMYRETRASVYLCVGPHQAHTCLHTHRCAHSTESTDVDLSFSLFTLALNSISPEGWRALKHMQHRELWFIPIFIRRSYGLYKARHLLRNGHRFPNVDHSNWIA